MKEGRAARNSSFLLFGALDILVLTTGAIIGIQQTASHEQLQRLGATVEGIFRGLMPVLIGPQWSASEPIQPLAVALGVTLVLLSVKVAFGTSSAHGLAKPEAI